MFYLFVALIAVSVINIVMRFSQDKITGKLTMFAANYITCVILSVIFIGPSNLLPMESGIQVPLLLGALNGCFYLSSLVLIQYNTKKNGVVLPSVFSRVGGLLLPFLASIAFFGERPGVLQLIGAVIAIGAIVAMNLQPGEKSQVGSMFWLLVLLVIDGCSGGMSKVYGELGSQKFSNHFVMYTFFVALILSVILAIRDKEKFTWREIAFGVAIGVPNFFASKFLLAALRTVPAVVAYPIRSVGSIVIISLAGLFLFHEKLKKNQWIAIGAILVAVVLLSI